MLTPNTCRCGHPRSRHFAGSMVKGHHACLAIDDGKSCECRCYEDDLVRGSVVKQQPKPAPRPELAPARREQRDKDLL